MKKLLILAAPFDLYKGGSEYQYKLIENELSAYYNIKYLFRHPKKTTNKKYNTYNYSWRKYYNRYNYSDALKIYRLTKKESPDIIYKRGLNYITAIGVYYAKKHNKKTIIHIASENDLTKFKLKLNRHSINEFIDKKINIYTLKNANKIICQADYQSKILIKNYNIKCNLILPNFHPFPKKNINKNMPIKILWVANMKRLKQPQIFINLAKKFENYKNIKFIMIGRPANNKWQKSLENSINNLPNLEYKGELPIEEVNKTLAQSHIFINTSLYEGFPNTFIQAMMRKVPIVSLHVDPDNVLTKNKIGFCSKSFSQLVTDINKLINNPALIEKMGIEAQHFSYKNYSIKNINKLLELFRD